MKSNAAQTGRRQGLQGGYSASRGREPGETLAQRAGRQRLSGGGDDFMRLYERGVLIGQIVDAIGSHEAENAICGANHSVPGPDRVPVRLPCQAEPGLEVANPVVGVVARPNRGLASDQVKIHILAIVGGARCNQLPAKAEIQRQIVFNAPVVLPKDTEETVAQVFISAAAISLLDILRKPEHEISDRTTVGRCSVTGELAIE